MVIKQWASPVRVEVIGGNSAAFANFMLRVRISIMNSCAGPAGGGHDALETTSQGNVMLFASMSHKGRSGVTFEPNSKTTATIMIGSISAQLESQVVLQLINNMGVREGPIGKRPFNTIDINPTTGFMRVPTSQRQQVHNIANHPNDMSDVIRATFDDGLIKLMILLNY
jgi:hypothetical protein